MVENKKAEGAASEAAPSISAEQLSQQMAELAKNIAMIAKGGNVSGGEPFDPSKAPAPKKLSAKEQAAEYFAAHKDFPWPGIHITSDGQIFLGNPHGDNARDNHIAASVVNGVATLKYESFKKPE